MKWSELDAKLKARLIRENPKDLNAAGIIPAVGAQKPQPVRRGEGEDRGVAQVPHCVGFKITIIGLRKRLVDGHDSFAFSYKPLADRITEWLGFKSDADPRLEWNYRQITITGTPGTIVQIEASLHETHS